MAITKFTTSGVNNIVKYDDFLAGNDAYDPGGYWPIASAVGTGSSGTITFSSIPSGYKQLQIRGIARTSGTNNIILLRFNSDTGSNYAYHNLYGDGSATGAQGFSAQTYIQGGQATTSTAAADIVGATIIDVLDFDSSTKYKTVRCLYGYDLSSSGSVRVASGLWLNTNAITSISLIANSSANWTTQTQFELYGIKEV